MSTQPTQQDVKERLMALHAMTKSPGWKLFSEYAAVIQRAARHNVFASDNPTAMAKYVGAEHALDDLFKWPEQEIAACAQFLEEVSNP